MDAKTEAHAIRSAFVGQPDDVLFSRKHMLDIADFIEQQETYAELGRLAVNTKICHCDYMDNECSYNDDCPENKYCKLRAELRKLEGCDLNG